MANVVHGVRPRLLGWARETAGYTVDDVAQRLKRTPEEVRSWERGDAKPTYAQLETLAYELYKRPLAVFFLAEPPTVDDATPNFRAAPSSALTPDTLYQVRVAKALQRSLFELYDGLNPAPTKLWRLVSLMGIETVSAASAGARATLGVDIGIQTSWPSADEAMRQWRSAVESVGVYVFKHAFKQKEISGLSLYDPEFPVIYLNNSMSKTRQIFSLFHEVGHILSRESSLSDQDVLGISHDSTSARSEYLCNVFAAKLLLPDDEVGRIGTSQIRNPEVVRELSLRYGVSKDMILLRLLESGRISDEFYRDVVNRKSPDESGTYAESTEGSTPRQGGNYYATQLSYLGESFTRLVLSRYHQSRISLEEASEYLGVKASSVDGLERQLSRSDVRQRNLSDVVAS